MTFPLESLLRGWRAALLLVAVVCASSGRASAGCGDYVTILPSNTAGATGTGGCATPVLFIPGNSTPGLPALPPAPPKGPCSGPNCSGAPEQDPAPLAPVTTSGPCTKEVAQVLGPAEPSVSPSSLVCDCTSPRPIRRGSSVFHPPRHG
jgi:hypothetical protein